MQKGNRKISYIRKPFARRSFISLGTSALACVCCVVSLWISVRMEGNGGLNMAAWGVSSLAASGVGIFYGLTAFMEKEKNYVLARISLGISGFLALFWICLVIVGLFS